MKKILQVCNTDFYLKKFLKPLIEELLNNNYCVHTACHTSHHHKTNEDKRVIHHNVDFPSSPNPLAFLKSIRQLIIIIKQNKYDCVNSHNRNASIAARIAAWWCKVPYNIYTAHGFYFHDDQSKSARWATIQLERFLSKITTHTFSQSQEDVDLMINNGYIQANDISWIGNGIDTQKFQPCENKEDLRHKLNLPQDKFIISAVGRLVKGKGFQDLIRTFIELNKTSSKFHLIIIGGSIEQDIDTFSNQIQESIRSNKLDEYIHLTGMVDNVEDYLSVSDAYVLPSYREGVSRSMLEAMSCDIPIIATKIRGCREIIKNKVNGLLFDAHDDKQLLNQINWLCNNPQEAKKYTHESQKLIKSIYNQTDYTNRQINKLNKLVNNVK
jgi:glycosyltransferase involved in cell wall biosynthesis